MADTETNTQTTVPYQTVISRASKEIQDAQNVWITVARSYNYNYLYTLLKIDLYYASVFVKGQFDQDNFKKLFSNISKYRVNTATKAINIGTKDVRISAEEGESYYPAWFFKKELHQYMKENEWGKLLNDICEKWPRYGTIIVKDVNGKVILVPLKNIIWDQTLPDISKSTFSDEKHIYNFDEFRQAGAELGWIPERVEEAIKLYETKKKFEIQVIEHYGFVEMSELDSEQKESKESVYARCMIAGLEFWDSKQNPLVKDLTNRPVVLEAAATTNPYRQLNWDEEPGRSLGVGIMEDLFSDQEQYNDVSHMERKSMHWATKKFWQTADDQAPANLFTQQKTGDVFTGMKKPLEPVQMAEMDLAEYNVTYQRIKNQADQKAFSYNPATGEEMATGTPFRLGALLSNAVNSHFAFKREKLGLFVEKLIWDFVIPGFKKDRYDEHVVTFDGTRDELSTMANFFIDSWLFEQVQDWKKKTGFYPTVQQYDLLKAKAQRQVGSREMLHGTLPKGFYDNLKLTVKIDVSGQDTNTVDMESMVNIFQVVGKNPAILDDPRISRMLDLIANQAGQSPMTLFGMVKQGSTPGGATMTAAAGAAPGGTPLQMPGMPGAGAPPAAGGAV